MLAPKYTVELVIGVIVLAIVLAMFLPNVFGLSPLFPDDKSKLVGYSTCALALCASGINLDGTPSPEVNQVGCLEKEDGECLLTCAQVPEKIYKDRDTGSKIMGGKEFFCGEDAKLEFEFGPSLKNRISLSSGQMQRLAENPKWICSPIGITIGGRTLYLDTLLTLVPGTPDTVDIQYDKELEFLREGPRDCVMKGDLFSTGNVYAEVISDAVLEIIHDNDKITSGGGCFAGILYSEDDGYESLFTPIYEYGSEKQKVHPSAIYLKKDKFTTTLRGETKPECNLKVIEPESITSDQIEQVADLYKNNTFCKGGALNAEKCDTEEVKWDELEIDEKSRFGLLVFEQEFGDVIQEATGKACPTNRRCNQFKSMQKPNNPLGNPITDCNFKTSYKGEKITYYVYAEDTLPSVFGLFGSCKTVTLDRDIAGQQTQENNGEAVKPKITVFLSVEKSEYVVGDTVIISGTVESSIPERRFSSFKKVRMSYLNKRSGFPASQWVDLKKDGTFESVFEIKGDILRGVTFEVTAEYREAASNAVTFAIK